MYHDVLIPNNTETEASATRLSNKRVNGTLLQNPSSISEKWSMFTDTFDPDYRIVACSLFSYETQDLWKLQLCI